MFIPLSIFGFFAAFFVISDVNFFFNPRRSVLDRSEMERKPIVVCVYSLICIISMFIMFFFLYLSFKHISWWVILLFIIGFITNWLPRHITIQMTGSLAAAFIFTNIYILCELGILIYYLVK